jgi:DNA-binding FadR family transcriptional regulator
MQVSYVSRPKSTNECRKVIEPGAPALATTRIDAASLDAPTRTHQAHAHPARPGGTRQRGPRVPRRHRRRDRQPHPSVPAGLGHPADGKSRIWRALVKSDVLSWPHEQHIDIYRALRAHDSLAAFTAADRHVNDVDAWVRDRGAALT